MGFNGFRAYVFGLALLPAAGNAADLALVLTNTGEDSRAGRAARAEAAALEEKLKGAGWRVFAASDAGAAEMRDLARQMADLAGADRDGDRILISLQGQFANDGLGNWFLDASGNVADRLGVAQSAISVEALAGVAALAEGRAVMLLGQAPGDLPELGRGLQSGLLAGRGSAALVPQGVTQVSGAAGELAGWAADTLLDPGSSLAAAVDALPGGAEAGGFISRAVSFAGQDSGPSNVGEIAYWNAVQDIGTAEARAAYLRRYPDGIFADEARAAAPKEMTPEEKAAADEAALSLGRDARRQVQRNLDLTGYDPKGIDGIFGRGSRSAIAAWQKSAGYDATGYLTRPQIDELQRQADIRAAELAREAEQRRKEEEARDRDFWQSLGRDETSLRAYLKRYPDGLYAEEAQALLDVILEQRRAEAEGRERAAWDQARAQDSIAGYEGFLRDFPEGVFAEEANARLAELTEERDNAGAIQRLQQAEAQVVPNQSARQLVERVLTVRGLNPGPVDGEFTRETRRAIRRFQKAQGLAVNGYVTQRTMVVLMLGVN